MHRITEIHSRAPASSSLRETSEKIARGSAPFVHFLGLGFERGQSQTGLGWSPDVARSRMGEFCGVHMIDHGNIVQSLDQGRWKVRSEAELADGPLYPYFAAYQQSLLIHGMKSPRVPLLAWGGDHSVGLSTVAAFSEYYEDGYVLWIDAHADLNLPHASATGNVHGMPLALLLNLDGVGQRCFPWLRAPLRPNRLIYLGLRDIDPFERGVLDAMGIKHFTMAEVRAVGMRSVASEILMLTRGKPLHVSFDIDSLDPELAPSTGVPVARGLNRNDIFLLERFLFEKSFVPSLDIVEINPMIGTLENVNSTYSAAFDFLGAALAPSRISRPNRFDFGPRFFHSFKSPGRGIPSQISQSNSI